MNDAVRPKTCCTSDNILKKFLLPGKLPDLTERVFMTCKNV